MCFYYSARGGCLPRNDDNNSGDNEDGDYDDGEDDDDDDCEGDDDYDHDCQGDDDGDDDDGDDNDDNYDNDCDGDDYHEDSDGDHDDAMTLVMVIMTIIPSSFSDHISLNKVIVCFLPRFPPTLQHIRKTRLSASGCLERENPLGRITELVSSPARLEGRPTSCHWRWACQHTTIITSQRAKQQFVFLTLEKYRFAWLRPFAIRPIQSIQ